MSDVIETMRPLPVDALPAVPAFVLGLSIVRGVPTPVIDLGTLLGSDAATTSTRFVTVRADGRAVALAIDSVAGRRELDSREFEALPPLLRDAPGNPASAIAALDHRLLTLLEAGRLLPDSLWQQLDQAAACTAAA